jgi:hypothetical protein
MNQYGDLNNPPSSEIELSSAGFYVYNGKHFSKTALT